MPNTSLEAAPELDLRLRDMIADIRNAIVHLLRPEQLNPATAANVVRM